MTSLDDFKVEGHEKGLILWDIDGTLVSKSHEFTYSRHLNALGLPQQNRKEMNLGGLSDWDVLVHHVQLNDLSNEILIQAFNKLNETPYQETPRQFTQCVGAERILKHGIGNGWIHGVLTGNVLNAAIGKLKAVDLLDYFDLSKVFCCEFQETRNKIARRARRHLSNNGYPVVLVGDTMNDVIAAKRSDFRVILISDSYKSIDASDKSEPDGVLVDLNINPADFYLELQKIVSK